MTIQQIGADHFPDRRGRAAGEGGGTGQRRRARDEPGASRTASRQWIFERVDDYCAAACTVCAEPQAVPWADVEAAIADLERRPYEDPDELEVLFG
ncbi:MAG TPA: hypothetical protein VJT49_20265 [Amycolatopsis sp.]|uniref:hypothetical protein n=1 Tax=Amycolatopsis sp. TaxID=37632 RepID=UPI002B45A8AB|nr:hypothetical protein [Amycolatopsis sp.]HKS47397.1 hypothetical protein [Amycolatopsis sp.]